MTAKSKAPTTTIKVNPLESVFEVCIEGHNFFDCDYYKFSISSDGTVNINDNVFSSKKQAVQVLEAMAAFLKK